MDSKDEKVNTVVSVERGSVEDTEAGFKNETFLQKLAYKMGRSPTQG